MFERVKDWCLDTTFKFEWRQGFRVHSPNAFEHNAQYPHGGPFSCDYGNAKNISQYTKTLAHTITLIDLMFDFKYEVCKLSAEVEQWLKDNKIVYRANHDPLNQHCLYISKKVDVALFLVTFEGSILQ